MAVAKCGMIWSWDSPLWCSGKKYKKGKDIEIDEICRGCAWWKGKNKKEEKHDKRRIDL